MTSTCCIYKDGQVVREWGREQFGNPMQLATINALSDNELQY